MAKPLTTQSVQLYYIHSTTTHRVPLSYAVHFLKHAACGVRSGATYVPYATIANGRRLAASVTPHATAPKPPLPHVTDYLRACSSSDSAEVTCDKWQAHFSLPKRAARSGHGVSAARMVFLPACGHLRYRAALHSPPPTILGLAFNPASRLVSTWRCARGRCPRPCHAGARARACGRARSLCLCGVAPARARVVRDDPGLR